MPKNDRREDHVGKGVTVVPPEEGPKSPRKEQEILREQSKTEIEERPYLDTEGGE